MKVNRPEGARLLDNWNEKVHVIIVSIMLKISIEMNFIQLHRDDDVFFPCNSIQYLDTNFVTVVGV